MESAKRVLEIFSKIALPYDENGGGPKGDAIRKIAESMGYKVAYIPKTGIIVAANEESLRKADTTVVSHFDLIPGFHKYFLSEKKRVKYKDNGIIQGCFDNTITNAAILTVLERNLESLKKKSDWRVFFSQEEETGLVGMKYFLEMFGNDGFFINLDVTNEGEGEFDKFFSVEYDYPTEKNLEKLSKALKVENGAWTTSRFTDDLSEILSSGGDGFSLCIPTEGNVHSKKNKTTIQRVEGYLLALESVFLHAVEEPFSKRGNEDKILQKYGRFDGVMKKEENGNFMTQKEIEEDRKKRWFGGGYQSSWNAWGEPDDKTDSQEEGLEERWETVSAIAEDLIIDGSEDLSQIEADLAHDFLLELVFGMKSISSDEDIYEEWENFKNFAVYDGYDSEEIPHIDEDKIITFVKKVLSMEKVSLGYE